VKTRGSEPFRVDRRTTLKWLAAAMAAAHTACTSDEKFLGDEIPPRPGSLLGGAAKPRGMPYGTDPDLVNPVVPWPRTMTEAQLQVSAELSDMILPQFDRSPAASAVGVPDFIDEWISAPYEEQQGDRELVLAGLEWLEQQSRERFGTGFATAENEQKSGLLDALASPDPTAAVPSEQVRFFERFRYLAVGAFYTTEPGMADAGYVGNMAINGDYPGPSKEALAHLAGVLEQLGLQMPA
jgi:hypothetical protein